jgi:uncharacterized DUF497 family protein
MYIHMQMFEWSDEKNEWLRKVRGLPFEDIVFHIGRGALVDVLEHPNQARYQGQRIFVVNIDDYIYLVPFVENESTIFLKTVIPSRKMTKKYLGGNPS